MKSSQKYEIHPIAQRIAEMHSDDYDLLRQSIKRDGLQSSIVLFENKILDGRHRYRACEELRIRPRFVIYSGSEPATFVFSNNVARRHLSVPDRLRALETFLPEIESEARRRQEAGTLASVDAKGKTSTMAAKLIGVSPATVERDWATQRAIERLEAAGRADAVDEVRKAAAKSVRAGAKAAAAAEMMLDAEPELLNRLRAILEPKEISAIENGTIPLSTSDLELWTKIDPEEAQQVRPLVMANHWTVSQSVAFLRDEITEKSKVANLVYKCLAAGGKYEVIITGCRITVVHLRLTQQQEQNSC